MGYNLKSSLEQSLRYIKICTKITKFCQCLLQNFPTAFHFYFHFLALLKLFWTKLKTMLNTLILLGGFQQQDIFGLCVKDEVEPKFKWNKFTLAIYQLERQIKFQTIQCMKCCNETSSRIYTHTPIHTSAYSYVVEDQEYEKCIKT